MSVSTLPTPVVPNKVSPIPSKAEWRNHLLAELAAGRKTLDEVSAELAAADKPANKPARVLARRTAKGSLWVSLGYKAQPGLQNSATLPVIGWQAIAKLVQDGTIQGFLDGFDSIPLSASAAKGGAT